MNVLKRSYSCLNSKYNSGKFDGAFFFISFGSSSKIIFSICERSTDKSAVSEYLPETQTKTHIQKTNPSVKDPVVENRTNNKSVKTSNAITEVSPVQGLFSEDAFAESADATAEIMSFFEQKAFDEDDE